MKINSKNCILIITALVLIAGLIGTGVSFNPRIYIDPVAKILVNRSEPATTIVSYYDLLEKKAFKSAWALYTPEAQQTISPELIEWQTTGPQISKVKISKVFLPRQVKNYAVVAYLRDQTIKGTNTEQVVLCVNCLIRRNFENTWSLTEGMKGIPNSERIELVKSRLDLDRLSVSDLEGYTPEQQIMVQDQIQAFVKNWGSSVEQANNLQEPEKIELVNFGKEFILKYAKNFSYLFAWRDPQMNSTPANPHGL